MTLPINCFLLKFIQISLNFFNNLIFMSLFHVWRWRYEISRDVKFVYGLDYGNMLPPFCLIPMQCFSFHLAELYFFFVLQ